jgi:hypothetical protein
MEIMQCQCTMSMQAEVCIGLTRVSDLAGSSMVYGCVKVCLYLGQGHCYRFQCLCCDTREAELTVKWEGGA